VLWLDPPQGTTELPTCPVCLERLDEHISGIVTTVRERAADPAAMSMFGPSIAKKCCQSHLHSYACTVMPTMREAS
jgi:BRCA1-associated protein